MDKQLFIGTTKAGANDCASASGSHSCAVTATKNNDNGTWEYVGKRTCDKTGGSMMPPRK